MKDPRILAGRFFLKDSVRREVDFSAVDQAQGIPAPPPQKPVPAGVRRIALEDARRLSRRYPMPLFEAVAKRRSRRQFEALPLSLDEISVLVWATQGLRPGGHPAGAYRNVPSAGARHGFETYLYARRVVNLAEGVYRYLPLSHELVEVYTADGLDRDLADGCLGQAFVGDAAAALIWTVIPQRMEWRYGAAAHKVLAVDAGHVMQNLYLACEAIGLGTCAIAAYDQERMDAFVRVDGQDEFVIYLAPVGRV